ncbi:uncharacterized protein LOC101855065 [Aplysia californica]|uniref:Uncharacterized protein LOC101855065 n=1 Tax=Aplysia californica TaxID=6500 RepID=A0ABM1A4V1_APLCA|nr:uncharacterized protein LOC101855065 [Aplysia californica]
MSSVPTGDDARVLSDCEDARMCNYSPCRDCAAELLKAINLAEEKKIKLNISITFVALNKIRRPSWINRGLCTAFGDVSINESNENILGLRLLLKAGVKLTSFNSETWRFLYAFLGQGLPSDSPGKFLSAKYSGAQSEARAEEDRWTQTDLKQILKGIHLTSPALSTENSMLPLAWSHPILVGNKVGEYRLTVRKVGLPGICLF